MATDRPESIHEASVGGADVLFVVRAPTRAEYAAALAVGEQGDRAAFRNATMPDLWLLQRPPRAVRVFGEDVRALHLRFERRPEDAADWPEAASTLLCPRCGAADESAGVLTLRLLTRCVGAAGDSLAKKVMPGLLCQRCYAALRAGASGGAALLRELTLPTEAAVRNALPSLYMAWTEANALVSAYLEVALAGGAKVGTALEVGLFDGSAAAADMPAPAPAPAAPAPAAPAPARRAAEVPELQAQGNDAFRAGDMERAVELYTGAIAEAPSAMLFANRSAALLALSRAEEALADAQRAVEGNPSWAKAHYRRAAALLATGDAAAAVDAALEALRRRPNDGRASQLLADAAQAAGVSAEDERLGGAECEGARGLLAL